MEQKANPMNGGVGENSYAKNSQYQRASSSSSDEMIKEAIRNNDDIERLGSNSNTIRVADLGCSVGPNTFFAMQNILEAIEGQFQDTKSPDFQVFFSDHASNDFNTLFTTLPPKRNYFVAGVPGSFYGRLFPDSSLHLVYSSHALNWLSNTPQEVLDKSSPSWNKGRIHYTNAPKQVVNAYKDQFSKDMKAFLTSRGDEITSGGMMILIIPGLPDGVHHSKHPMSVLLHFLEQTLMDMVKSGSVNEAEVDSFNIPVYAPTLLEMRELVQTNGCFSIEKFEIIDPISMMSEHIDGKTLVMHLRAGHEGVLTKHFGREIIDQLFERTFNKSGEISSAVQSSYPPGGTHIFLVLKRH